MGAKIETSFLEKQSQNIRNSDAITCKRNFKIKKNNDEKEKLNYL